LNPIEHTWAALKRYIKRFRHNFDTVTETIEYVFHDINYFYHSTNAVAIDV